MFKKIAFSTTITALLFIVISAVSASAVVLCFTQLLANASITGTVNNQSVNETAGVFQVTVDNQAQYAFCTDIYNGIGYSCYSNSSLGVTDPMVACVLQYYPPEANLTNNEAAARQAAVWYYSDSFIITSPAPIVTRTNGIIADIEAKAADGDCDQVTTPTISIMPASGVTFLADDGNGGYLSASADYIVTVMKGSNPLANQQVTINTTVGSLNNNGSTVQVITDSNGEATVTLSNNTVNTSVLSATTTVVLQAGTRIDPGPTTQKLVLSGSQDFDLDTQVNHEWVAGANIVIRKFRDSNHDGVFNDNEVLINWSVKYRVTSNGGYTTTNLGNDGILIFGADPNQTYEVCEVPNNNWARTLPANSNCYTNVTAPFDALFGNVELPALRIEKYHDRNGNGQRDQGEEALDGWSFQVDRFQNGDWSASYSGLTANGGILGFDHLSFLNYRVTEESIEEGWYVSTTNPVERNITANQLYTVAFGNLQPAQLTINKTWLTNGEEDDDPGATAYVCIERTDNNTPAYDLVPTGATEEDGAFCLEITDSVSFDNLWPGTYEIVEAGLPGWTTAAAQNVELSSGDEAEAEITNSRNVQPSTRAVTVQKFNDLDGDGVRDDGEALLDDWHITVNQNGNTVAEGDTGDNGAGTVIFNLAAGTYQICETLQDGWENPSDPDLCKTVTVGAGADPVAGPNSVTVSFTDNQGTNSYTVALTSHVGNTWTYTVTRVGGKNLSHWTLGIIACQAHFTSYTNGAQIGQDGNRPFSGIKWNTTGGTFSFTLDADYPVGTVDVQVKAGSGGPNGDGTAYSQVAGPLCNAPAPIPPVLFGNRELGSITIYKQVNNEAYDRQFAFTYTVGNNAPQTFYLSDTHLNTPQTETELFDNLPAGTYTFSENLPLPAGWSLVGYVCSTQPSPEGIPDTIRQIIPLQSGNGFSINLNAGEDVYCSFGNVYVPPVGSLSVTKQVEWNGATPDSTEFRICVTGPSFAQAACEMYSDDETHSYTNLIPGQYTVTEDDPGSLWTVNPVSRTVNVQVAANQTAPVTVTNTHVAPSVISPILECVIDNGGGNFTAYFGYNNPNAFNVTLPIGNSNKFTPAPQDRGQPTNFAPGRTPFWPNAAFSVPFDGNNLVWTLNGRTSTASNNPAQRCQYHVFVTKVWQDVNGNAINGVPQGVDLAGFSIVATSSLETLTCAYVSSVLTCTSSLGGNEATDGLDVLVGESYTVSESGIPAYYANVSGLGEFTQTAGGENCGLQGLAKYCSHTVTNRAQPRPDVRLNLTAECRVGDLLYWRVTGDNDVNDVNFTWYVYGNNAVNGSGQVDANARAYFTTPWVQNNPNTTIVRWFDPADNRYEEVTKAHNSEPCVYHVTFVKTWTGVDESPVEDGIILTADSSIATATCTYSNGAWACEYIRKGNNASIADLEVPFGETYDVTEVAVAGWEAVAGVGTGFEGIDGFDTSALPNALVYDVSDNRYCETTTPQQFNPPLDKFCTHEVVNEQRLGSIQVHKTVEGAPDDLTATFEICVLGGQFGMTPNCKTTDEDGGTLIWENLTAGNYTVRESNPGVLWVTNPASRQFMNVMVVAGETTSRTFTNTYRQPACPATELNQVTFYEPGTQKDGGAVPDERQHTERAEGFAQNNDTNNFLSLGFGGVAIIDFPTAVLNGPGDDVRIVETSFGDSSRLWTEYPEVVKVEASQDGVTWVQIALTTDKDQSYDLGSLDWARYFRLTDMTDPDDFTDPDADGFDIDAVEGINCGQPEADVAVIKSGPNEARVGDTFTYTLRVTNHGPNTAVGVTVEDTLPAGLSVVSANTPYTFVGNVYTFEIGTLANGEYVNITINVTASPNLVDRRVCNVAVVSSDPITLDPNTRNNTDDACTRIKPPRLPICDVAYAAEVITYLPGVSRGGPIQVNRTNPANALGAPQNNDTINFVSLGFGDGRTAHLNATSGVLVLKFDVQIIPNAADADLTVVETSFGGLTFNNYPEQAEVYASQDGINWVALVPAVAQLDTQFELPMSLPWAQYIKFVDVTDPTRFTNNNTSDGFDVDGVGACATRPEPDLTVVKTDSPDPVQSGGHLTYTLNVISSNASPSAAVHLVDTLPASVSNISVSSVSNGGVCAVNDHTVTCDWASLPGGPGTVSTVELAVYAPVVTVETVITNTVTISSPSDSNPNNNTDDEPTTVLPPRTGTITITKVLEGEEDNGEADSAINFAQNNPLYSFRISRGGGAGDAIVPMADANMAMDAFVPIEIQLEAGQSSDPYALEANTYIVEEFDIPEGFHLEDIDCGEGVDFTVDYENNQVILTLNSDDDIECIFTNAPNDGTITITKVLEGEEGNGEGEADSAMNFAQNNPLYSFRVSRIGGGAGDAVVPMADANVAMDYEFPIEIQLEAGQSSEPLALAPDTYIIEEFDIPEGFHLEDIDCGEGVDFVFDEETNSVTVTINSDDDIECTFTNAPNDGTITITKEVVGQEGGEEEVNDSAMNFAQNNPLYSFRVSRIGGGAGDAVILSDNPMLQAAQDAMDPIFPIELSLEAGQSSEPLALAPDTYIIEEFDIPEGFHLEDIDCGDGVEFSVDYENNQVTITINSDDDIECTFTNAGDTGSITVNKVVEWGDVTPTEQTFNICVVGPVTLCQELVTTNGGELVFNDLPVGSYTVTEPDVDTVLWTYTGANVTLVDHEDAEEVTVTNSRTAPQNGTLIIRKESDVAGTFNFTSGSEGINPNFSLTTVEDGDNFSAQTSFSLPAGNYDVSETIPTDWLLTGRVCTSSNDAVDYQPLSTNGVMVTLASGETVTCVFTNDYQEPPVPGSLTVIKSVVWSNASIDTAATFTINVTGPNNYSQQLVFDYDGGSETLSNLTPGQYTVTEVNPGVKWTVTYSPSQTVNVTAGTNGGAEVTVTNTHVRITTCEGFDYAMYAEMYLTGRITVSGNTATGRITNNGTQDCAILVGLVSYSMFDRVIDNQTIFDYDPLTPTSTDSPFTVIPPNGGSVTFTVDLPVNCAAQVDLFYGPLLPSLSGQRYGTRLLAWTQLLNRQFCQRPGTLILRKDADAAGAFTFNIPGYGDVNLTTTDNDLSDEQQISLNPGSYSITEAAQDNWVLSNAVCDNVGINNGGTFTILSNTTVTCVFTNDYQEPEVTVEPPVQPPVQPIEPPIVETDTDGDGSPDNVDTDDDNDSVEDANDAFPLDVNESVDTDGDSTGNNADTDDDADGVEDAADAFPLDVNESVDTDNDGTGDNADTDDDADSVEDANDAFPLDASESVDTDGDTLGNNVDTDDDADGLLDDVDPQPLIFNDSDGDTIGDGIDDSNGDSIVDAYAAEIDADGDTFSNADEFAAGTNPYDNTSFPTP